MSMIFPTELITLLGSTLISGALSFIGMKAEAAKLEKMHMLKLLDKTGDLIKDAREYENAGFQWTRRLLAVLITLAVIVFPMYAQVFHPEIPINVGQVTEGSSFFFGLFSSPEQIKWITLERGLTITPMHTHLMSAIAGLYFGASITKVR